MDGKTVGAAAAAAGMCEPSGPNHLGLGAFLAVIAADCPAEPLGDTLDFSSETIRTAMRAGQNAARRA